MVDPNWGLMQGNNALQYFQYGQQIGAQARESQDRRTMNNALATYITNPKDEAAFQTIAKLDPRTAMQLQQQRVAADKEARRAKIIPLAAKGDQNAMLELWGMDPDMAMKLDDGSKKKVLDSINYVSNAAFQIVQLPENQRAAAWDSYIDQGMQMFPGLAQYKGKYSPDALNSIVSQAGKMQEFQKFQQPNYVPKSEFGMAGFQFGQPIMEGGQVKDFAPPAQQQVARPADKAAYDALPPGTQYVAPDGSVRTKGGASVPAGGPFRPVGVNQSGVTSTYRTPKHNAEVGGVKNSYHTRRGVNGEPLAVDSVPPSGMSMADYAAKLRRLNPNYDVINEGDHVHIEPKG